MSDLYMQICKMMKYQKEESIPTLKTGVYHANIAKVE